MAERTGWSAILLTYGLGVAGAVQVGRVAPAAEALRAEIGLDLAALGWAVSLITLPSAALGLAAGHLVLRRGPRRVLVIGKVVLAAAVLASAFASGPMALLAIRVVEGVGYLGLVVAAPTLMAREAAPRDAPAALALWGTFFTLGLSVAAIAGGWLTEAAGWRAWSGANAVLLAGAAAVAWRVLPTDSIAQDQEAGAEAPSALPRAAWLLGAAFLGVTLLTLALLSMLPSFLVAARGFSPGAAGAATGLVALASVPGSLTYGVLATRLAPGGVVAAAAALVAASAPPAFAEGLPAAWGVGFAAAAVLGSGVLVAHVFASVPRLVSSPAQIGPANGVVAQLGSAGALAGPPLVGGLVSGTGWLALPVLIVLFTATFAILVTAAERAAMVRRAA